MFVSLALSQTPVSTAS